MKAVIQRVQYASVTVDNNIIGKINKGLLVFLGVSDTDTAAEADRMLSKIIKLRIFADDSDKTNLALEDIGGEMLVVSQFTLLADCRKGNRPSFTTAGSPEHAKKLYEYFVSAASSHIDNVQHGEFGADMKVELLNDGPFTIILEAADGKIL